MRARVHRKMAINSRRTWPLLFRSGGGGNPTNKELPVVSPSHPLCPSKKHSKSPETNCLRAVVSTMKKVLPIDTLARNPRRRGGRGETVRGGRLNGAEIRQSEVNK